MLHYRFTRILFGVTLGVLVALLILPQTRWLVHYQVLSALHLAPVPGTEAAAIPPSQIDAVAATRPGSYQAQLAARNWLYNSAVDRDMIVGGNNAHVLAVAVVRTLGSLKANFPDNPAVLASILQVDCSLVYASDFREMRIYDPQEYYGNHLNQNRFTPRANNPEILAEFIANAHAGQALEPKNAFFPLMLAYALFAAHKDSAAESALLLAGTEPRWNDYLSTTTVAEWNLLSKVDGDKSSVLKYVIAASQEIPSYGAFRAVSRFADYHAAFYTSSGQVQKGIALRQAIIHCGYLLYRDPANSPQARVGIALSAVAMLHVGPQLSIAEVTKESVAAHVTYLLEYSIQLQNTYTAYLRRHGDSTDAKVVEKEGICSPAGRRAIRNYESLTVFRSFAHTTVLWIICLLLIGNVVCLLAIRVFTSSFSVINSMARISPVSRKGAFAVLWLLGIVLLVAIGWWIGRPAWSEILIYTGVPYLSFSPPKFYFLFALLTLSAPLLLVIVSIARMGRAPIRHTLASAALPAACVLLLLYTAIVAGIASQERSFNGLLTQQQQSASQDVAANSVRGALTRVG